MKITAIIARVLMGALFVFGSVTYFLKLFTPPPMEGSMKVFYDGLEAAGYLLPVAKTIELLCGIAFLSGRFIPLATVLIAPIIVNIFFILALMEPKRLPVALFLVIANGLLAYVHRDSYKPLFKA